MPHTMIVDRVPTDLESQEKTGKIKWSKKVRELFLFPQKVRESLGTFLLNADYLEIKQML